MYAGLCKRRCFPPVALAWDATSGLHVFPNLYSETIVVDSSPALWTSSQDSDKTTVLLLVLRLKSVYLLMGTCWLKILVSNVFYNFLQVDPHCSYRSTIDVSVTASAGRFLLLYFSQVNLFLASSLFLTLTFQMNLMHLFKMFILIFDL